MLSAPFGQLRRPSRAAGQQGKAPPSSLSSPLKSTSTQARAVAADQLQYWDVVEYNTAAGNQPARRLGLVQQVTPDSVQVSPLVEEVEGVWVPDDEAQIEEQIGISSVLQIVDHVYGQRQDQEHNPHGEHAHDVWQVMLPIPEEVYRGNVRSLRK